MGYQFLCPAGGQGINEALELTRYFVYVLHTLLFQPSEALRALKAHGSPLVLAEAVALAAALLSWLWYLVTRNCSHVDRMWSILPPIYVAIFGWEDIKRALAAVHVALTASNSRGTGGAIFNPRILTAISTAVSNSGADGRLLVATALTAVWGCRLTFNFWRKGGYSLRYEDYRWAKVRKLMHPVRREGDNRRRLLTESCSRYLTWHLWLWPSTPYASSSPSPHSWQRLWVAMTVVCLGPWGVLIGRQLPCSRCCCWAR
ncbi:hypothetical protein Vretimale_19582 [Volvox reticuliferus]|uniref:Uncharacterized protein n=1 Tax=Volvox reticuliferus TaxID=1737510 RepID=A0A8J4D2D1_9CHLO|nr:hypothetical protein Vretifemale_19850 [Volvox reticuliferus]GIM17042.1 hypothetical protein Vretimale_19582 [Volvox reticuliferus]